MRFIPGNRVAPLRAITHTERGETVIDVSPELKITAPTLIHTLECGHKAEPLIRMGARLPYPPKRRRCKECMEGKR
jgi:hypothetical protein